MYEVDSEHGYGGLVHLLVQSNLDPANVAVTFHERVGEKKSVLK